jgi:hypothetical protein
MDTMWSDTLPGVFESGAGEPLAWFEAPTPGGPLRLAVATLEGAPRHAAAAAIALHGCEPLLAGLEDWAGDALDWRWTGEAPHPVPGSVTIGWRDGLVRLQCPWSWLRRPRRPLQGCVDGLALPGVAATLVAARLHLPSQALLALEPGGALIVPASLQPVWCGVLRAAGQGVHAAADAGGVVVALAGVDGATPMLPRYAPALDPAAAFVVHGDPAHRLCELRLDLPHPVPTDGLAGWREGPVGAAGPAASLWLCRQACGDARPLARGHLMPWGDGWALAIGSVGGADG